MIGPYVLTHLPGKYLARLGPHDYQTLLSTKGAAGGLLAVVFRRKLCSLQC